VKSRKQFHCACNEAVDELAESLVKNHRGTRGSHDPCSTCCDGSHACIIEDFTIDCYEFGIEVASAGDDQAVSPIAVKPTRSRRECGVVAEGAMD
jgi:hypothetical protein